MNKDKFTSQISLGKQTMACMTNTIATITVINNNNRCKNVFKFL